jgi:hypothetical protein
VFQMFQWYVASVSRRCCKSRSGCCTCCDSCRCMLQASVRTVSSVFFPNVRCKCVYLDVAYVLHICCKCFIYMLHMFYNGFQMFFMIFCKCFIYLQTYVAVAACGYFKSKSGVASYSSLSSASPQCLLLFPTPARHPPPLPSFSMLVMFKAARAPCGRAKQHENGCRRRHLDVPSAQTLASPLLQSYFASLESQHH